MPPVDHTSRAAVEPAGCCASVAASPQAVSLDVAPAHAPSTTVNRGVRRGLFLNADDADADTEDNFRGYDNQQAHI